MTNLLIRRAIEAYLPLLLNLYRELHADDPTISAETLSAVWTELSDHNHFPILLGLEGTEIVASCAIAIIPNLTRGGKPHALIENVITRSDHRKRGHGRAILTAALDLCWARGCYKVMLATGSKRPETLRFYEMAGFERNSKTCFVARRPF